MITITQTMYDKSCIDANKTVYKFFEMFFGENPYNTYGGYFMLDGVFVGDSTVKLFKTKGRQDRRISFSDWKKWVNVGNIIKLDIDENDQIAVIINKGGTINA